ncbi:hypothetical protein Vi05172_g7259 [Venturia inaequalis]|nr:hypothetical protein Vi05172_g7259 [Venturia inaequalis]
MKLTTTLLLGLAVNSVAAGWTCYKKEGTDGVCSPYGDSVYSGPNPQLCRKGILDLEAPKTVPPAGYAPAQNPAQIIAPARNPYELPAPPPPAQQHPKTPTGWDIPLNTGGPGMEGMNHDKPPAPTPMPAPPPPANDAEPIPQFFVSVGSIIAPAKPPIFITITKEGLPPNVPLDLGAVVPLEPGSKEGVPGF